MLLSLVRCVTGFGSVFFTLRNPFALLSELACVILTRLTIYCVGAVLCLYLHLVSANIYIHEPCVSTDMPVLMGSGLSTPSSSTLKPTIFLNAKASTVQVIRSIKCSYEQLSMLTSPSPTRSRATMPP